ncbi:hypothetical protein DFA_08363 [Cavenderia fasciculata]|uniref:Maltase n=1 Tax=Cavenderia fasciculata TaxID=261658 RepID=F4Q5V9_CACFS|nr:uncharacterized protein DFA_08363 [Cavenderia fasciculata]EGG17368.1 hypothetical protein DFA_08363 [Cavenderia fasciculata]|eukprot:XP_004355852.1 hypothetical protein DFA_08363 [Cavenderia fasciculata]
MGLSVDECRWKKAQVISIVNGVKIEIDELSSSSQPSSCNPGYTLSYVQETKYGYTGQLAAATTSSGYGDNLNVLAFDVYYHTEQMVRFKIYDPKNERWEVPLVNLLPYPQSQPSTTDYKVSFTSSPFGFAVVRQSTGEILFNSTPSAVDCTTNGLLYSDYYIELSTTFEELNPNLYGLGERAAPLRLENTRTYTMYAKGVANASTEYTNLYGSHPFYLQLLGTSGNAHGVFMLNSNAMDVVMQPNALTYKMIGGIVDMFIVTGPTPVSVVQQYTQIIGRTFMPSYWSLGWHQCRWGYTSIEETAQVVANYSLHGIPLETMWNDIDYMNAYMDFTLDPVNFNQTAVRALIDQLHENNQHYMMIVDPGIHNQQGYESYDSLVQSNAYLKTTSGEQQVGWVWPGSTIFPDFFHPNASQYWLEQFQAFREMVPFDGIWLDMNELANFCNACIPWLEEGIAEELEASQSESSSDAFDPNNPPYVPGTTIIYFNSINMSTVQYNNTNYYDAKSLYGFMESMVTTDIAKQLLNQRSTLISRSTFPGTGRNNGHWLGDNASEFVEMYWSIPGIIAMNLFGINLVGADICGFNGNTTVELCTRWTQLGVFYPFSRNHNAIGMNSQEPYVLGQQVIDATITGVNNKYTLLPYYYTLFHWSHISGSPVIRPLWMEYPLDSDTYNLDTQFLVGGHLLVSPVLQEGATTVQAYFPQDSWFDYFTGAPVASVGQTLTLDAPIDVINVHVRGGVIMPLQPTASYVPPADSVPITTKVARTLPFHLLIAIPATSPFGNTTVATGELFLDDGISIDTYENDNYTFIRYDVQKQPSGSFVLTSSIESSNYFLSNSLTTITVYGITQSPTYITLDNTNNISSYTFDSVNQVLLIDIDLPIVENYQIYINFD